jgi:histidyl-tRNA synthetase
MEGFCEGLGIMNVPPVLRTIDKLAKVGEQKVAELLRQALDERQTSAVLEICRIQANDESFVKQVKSIGVVSPKLDEGLAELVGVLHGNSHLRAGAIQVNLRIARGFDYYTGTVYEGLMEGFESMGAVCSGGRYDDLVTLETRAKEKHPGVGISIGISRILGLWMGRGRLVASRSSPSCVLVALNSEDHYPRASAIARALRGRGIPTEVFQHPSKYSQQIRYAVRKRIPYVWFHDTESGRHEVRDLASGTQSECDLETWAPAAELLHPQVLCIEGQR